MTGAEQRPVTDPSDDRLLLPEVERSLTAAIRRRGPTTATAGPRRRRPWRRFSRRTGLLSIAGLLVGGTALAATAPWAPQLGDDRVGHPTVATRTVPGDQLAALAVLRRPQTDADRGPWVEAMLARLPSHEIGGVHLDSVRLLTARPHGATVLLAAERMGSHDRGYPSSRRHHVLCLLNGDDDHASEVSGGRPAGRRGSVAPPPKPGLSFGITCGTVADIDAGRTMTGAQWAGRLGLSGLVPDRVARIEVPLSTGRVIRADVVDNTFRIDAAVPDGSYQRNRIRWLDRDGNLVHRRWRR